MACVCPFVVPASPSFFARPLMCKILSETVFLGFKNLTIGDTLQIDNAAVRAGLLRKFSIFREEIIKAAGNLENFRREEVAAEGKSSKKDSAGS